MSLRQPVQRVRALSFYSETALRKTLWEAMGDGTWSFAPEGPTRHDLDLDSSLESPFPIQKHEGFSFSVH